MHPDRIIRVLAAAVLALLSFQAFSEALSSDFICIDDPFYVFANEHVTGGLSLRGILWAFTTVEMANWHPLTWVSYMADTSLFGTGPRGYHLTNLLLHTANALLCLWLFSLWTRRFWAAFLIALLWGIHPLRAESVIWISERKDVLSGFFGLLSLIAYTYYARSEKKKLLWAAWFLLLLGLLSKSMLVTWPFVFLLADYWPLKRLTDSRGLRRCVIWEKIPFFFLTIVFSGMAFYAQQAGGAVISAETFPLSFRVLNAAVSYVQYLKHLFWPTKLSFFYPIYHPQDIPWTVLSAFVFLSVCTACFLRFQKTRPSVWMGWLWYIGTLVPVIGLVQIGLQSMADRYTYLPSLGIGLMVVHGFGVPLWSAKRLRFALAGLSAAACVFLLVCSWTVSLSWKDSLSLFARAAKVTENNPIVWIYYGKELEDAGLYQEAAEQYERLLRLYPESADAYHGLGRIALQLQNYEKSEQLLLKAEQLSITENPFLLESLARLYLAVGNFPKAESLLNKAQCLCEPKKFPTLFIRLNLLEKQLQERKQELYRQNQ
ncbi:MAG: tetratricopeptide repeat protein [Anaerohalosphaeraceae bacterium]